MKLNFTKMLLILFFLSVLTLHLSTAQPEELPYKVFKLKYLNAKDTAQTIKILLSSNGRAVSDERLNLLIVSDYEENLVKVEEFLNKYDVIPPNIKIEAKIVSEDELERSGILVNWQIINNYWRVSVVSPGEEKIKSRNRMELLLMSGTKGMISTGTKVPYPHLFYTYSINHGYDVISAVDFYDVSSGLTVKPRIIGNTDQIELEIEPYISYNAENNKAGQIIFKKIATIVNVKSGQSIVIGANQQIKENIISSILSGSLEEKEKTNFITILTATIIK